MSGVLTSSIGGGSVNQLGNWMTTVIRATTESNVPLETVLTCCEFGSILPSTNFTRSKIEIIARKNQNRTVGFLKSQVGWQNDVASVLAESRSGLNLLSLAAILCSVAEHDLHKSSLILNNIMESLVENEEKKNHLPPLGSIRRLLIALRPKLLRSGFEAMFQSWTDLWENRLSGVPPHTYLLQRFTVPITILEHLIPAFIKLSQEELSSIRIKSFFSVPWLISITCWLLGRPPMVIREDGETIFSSDGSSVIVVVPTNWNDFVSGESDTDWGSIDLCKKYENPDEASYYARVARMTPIDGSENIEIKTYYGMKRFEEIVKPRNGTAEMTMMIEWPDFWRQRFRLQADVFELDGTSVAGRSENDNTSSQKSYIGALVNYWKSASRQSYSSVSIKDSIQEAIALGAPQTLFNNRTTSKVFDTMSETDRIILITLPFATRQLSKLLICNHLNISEDQKICPSIFPNFQIIERALIRAFPHHEKLLNNDITKDQLTYPLTTKVESLPGVATLLASFPKCNKDDDEFHYQNVFPDWDVMPLDRILHGGNEPLLVCQRCSFFSKLARYALDILCYSFIHNNVGCNAQNIRPVMEEGSDTIRVSPKTAGGMSEMRDRQLNMLGTASDALQTGERQISLLTEIVDWLYGLLDINIPEYEVSQERPQHLHRLNWMGLSVGGQVVYHRNLEHKQINDHEGLFALSACPCVFSHRREVYHSAFCISRKSRTQLPSNGIKLTWQNWATEGYPPWSLFKKSEDTVQYELAISVDNNLEIEIFIPSNTYHERIMLGFEYFDYRVFGNAIFARSCEHPKDNPSELFRKHCILAHPLCPLPSLRYYSWDTALMEQPTQSQNKLEGKIAVVPVAQSEALRFLAFKMKVHPRPVLRFDACMDCCIKICLKMERTVIIA